MPFETIGGIQIYYKLTGTIGEPLVMVHGSWADHRTWNFVLPSLSRSLRVLTYDRRGYHRSDPVQERTVSQDASDLGELVERLHLAPAHFVGSSLGGSAVLWLAGERPGLFRSLIAHEPPLFRILKNDPDEAAAYQLAEERTTTAAAQLDLGDIEGGTKMFVDTLAFGPGTWDRLPSKTQQTFFGNAGNWLKEIKDPEALWVDVEKLRGFPHPALLTVGAKTGAIYPPVVRKLASIMPHATIKEFEKSAHVPHLSHPGDFLAMVTGFIGSAAGPDKVSV